MPSAPKKVWIPAAWLMLGVAAIGMAPIFVRWSTVGPVSTAFWRLILAWSVLKFRPSRPAWTQDDRNWRKPALIAGLAFGADLGVWHISVRETSVANATLLANLAPIFMLLIAQIFLDEPIRKRVWFAIALSFSGVLLLLGGGVSLHGSRGDAFGFLTAIFYSIYLLALRRIPRSVSSMRVLSFTSFTGAMVVLPFALVLEPKVVPHTLVGVLVLVGLAGVSQILGQGLITRYLAEVPASLSSAILVCQSAFAAFFGWCFLGESLGVWQGIGALLMLLGVFWVRLLAIVPRLQVSPKGKK